MENRKWSQVDLWHQNLVGKESFASKYPRIFTVSEQKICNRRHGVLVSRVMDLELQVAKTMVGMGETISD